MSSQWIDKELEGSKSVSEKKYIVEKGPGGSVEDRPPGKKRNDLSLHKRW